MLGGVLLESGRVIAHWTQQPRETVNVKHRVYPRVLDQAYSPTAPPAAGCIYDLDSPSPERSRNRNVPMLRLQCDEARPLSDVVARADTHTEVASPQTQPIGCQSIQHPPCLSMELAFRRGVVGQRFVRHPMRHTFLRGRVLINDLNETGVFVQFDVAGQHMYSLCRQRTTKISPAGQVDNDGYKRKGAAGCYSRLPQREP